MKAKISNILLCIAALMWCSCGSPNGPQINLPEQHTITISTNDFIAEAPIEGVSIEIPKAGYSSIVSSSSFSLSLDEGLYDIFLSKDGYITLGYSINLDSDITINALLYASENAKIYDPEDIHGTVAFNGAPFQDDFNVIAGRADDACVVMQIAGNSGGEFSHLQAFCGALTVCAFTIGTNSEIDMITYNNGVTLDLLDDFPGTDLSFSDTTFINYNGAKPLESFLFVKTGAGYYLARQGENTASYDFDINLVPGDTIYLSACEFDGASTLFTKTNAGNAGGSLDLGFTLSAPACTIAENQSHYTISINDSIGVSYYEYHIVDTGDPVQTELLMGIKTTGESINVPLSMLPADLSLIEVRITAIVVPAYSEQQFLAGDLPLDQLSYAESAGLFTTSLKSYGALSERGSILETKNLRKATGNLKVIFER